MSAQAQPRRGILLIGNHPPPFGGVPTHLAYLAPHLANAGWDVHVLTQKYRTPPIEAVGDYKVYGLEPRRRIARLQHALRHTRRAWQARSLLADSDPREMLRILDLHHRAVRISAVSRITVVSAYHVFPSGLVGAWLASALRVPLITTIFGEFYSARRLMIRRRCLVQRILNASRRLLSCSKHCAEGPRAAGLDRVAEVLYYGVDLTRFSPVVRAQHLRKHYGIGPDDTVAVFVGRMVDEMGLATLLSAIPAVIRAKPSFRFVVAGRKGDLTNEALQLRAAFPDRLVVIPDASDDELPFLYAAASMVVVPSRDDRACLGLAAAEGMASGKPVIITSAGGGSEVVVDRETGLVVPPADVAALTNALLELAGDPERARKMGLRGRQRAEVMFDKDATNRAMERILLEVAV